MKIAFLSSLNPDDRNSWSGTLYYIYASLKRKNEVTWIGAEVGAEVIEFHYKNFGEQKTFIPEEYAQLFGILLSKMLKTTDYDLIVCRDYFFVAYLCTDLPLIYIGDTTFHLFNQYLQHRDSDFIQLADTLERRSIHKSDRIIYSSEWAKESAIRDYGASPEKIQVIEFGANIDNYTSIVELTPACSVCNLVFIGKNWHNKGGEKALNTYLTLRERGFRCSLTIIGSSPTDVPDDKNIHIFPFIDKSTQEGKAHFEEILRQTHFLILPTRFDCFGIVFCEASAYGIPSLATRTGGVGQVIREGKNGYLFSEEAPATVYADKIQAIFENEPLYKQLRESSRKEFEERLNWNIWESKVNRILEETLAEREEEEFYIPVYAINMKEREDRRKHILKEFEGKEEFVLTVVDACTHAIGAVGLWESIVHIINMAQESGEDAIIICEDDHYFTEHYSKRELFRNIMDAYAQGADLLSGGIGGFGQAVPVASNRYWIDWLWCTQFIVIHKDFYQRILDYQFRDTDTADGVLSQLSANKMVVYPFISEQRDFGYSDVTQSNKEHAGMIREHFARANNQLKMVHRITHLAKQV